MTCLARSNWAAAMRRCSAVRVGRAGESWSVMERVSLRTGSTAHAGAALGAASCLSVPGSLPAIPRALRGTKLRKETACSALGAMFSAYHTTGRRQARSRTDRQSAPPTLEFPDKPECAARVSEPEDGFVADASGSDGGFCPPALTSATVVCSTVGCAAASPLGSSPGPPYGMIFH